MSSPSFITVWGHTADKTESFSPHYGICSSESEHQGGFQTHLRKFEDIQKSASQMILISGTHQIFLSCIPPQNHFGHLIRGREIGLDEERCYGNPQRNLDLKRGFVQARALLAVNSKDPTRVLDALLS